MLRNISSPGFPPFSDFDINLFEVEKKPKNLAEVHLFTGINGTGKTRILSAIAALCGHFEPLMKRLKGYEHRVDIWAGEQPIKDASAFSRTILSASAVGVHWQQPGNLYKWLEQVPAFAYSGSAYLEDAQVYPLNNSPRPDRKGCLSFYRPSEQSAALLQGIVNLHIQAGIDSYNSNASLSRPAKLIRRLEEVISSITKRSFKFHLTTHPQISLKIEWDGICLGFDSLPDGLRSIIGWLGHAVVNMNAWLQGVRDPDEVEALFLLDEIECHLHPAWQRQVLPAFQRLFPRAMILVSSHSPFLIASLNHGWIHPLTLQDDGKVKIEQPKKASEGDSYVSVVESIMGVKEWYDPETEELLADFRALRDAAYQGDVDAAQNAINLAGTIARRSVELSYMMGGEISQMKKQLDSKGS